MNDNSKYIILKRNNTGMIAELSKYINNKNFENMYKNINCDGFIFRIMKKLDMQIVFFLLNDWKKHIKEYEQVIIFDDGYISYISKYIKKFNENCKIIFYYWNQINSYNSKFLYDKNIDEIWTFDREDSKKYNIKYNPQFYTRNIQLQNSHINNDVLFLGRAKNRKNVIIEIENRIKEQNIRTDFHIIESEKDFIRYYDYLKMVDRSKCILDIVNENQIGLTLRCMEAIFLKKKLITNNKDIKQYEFYNENNIFIIGEDNYNNLKDFIEKEYVDIDENIINKYEFKSWLERFFKNGEGEKI